MTEHNRINEPKALLGRAIQSAREKKGLSQKGLAEAIGKPSQTVNKWERGVRWPDFGNIELIARTLGVDVIRLFEWAPAPPAPPSIATLAAEVDRQAAEIARLKRELERLEIPPAYRELVALVLTVDQAKVPALCDMIRMTLAGNPNGSLKPGKKLDHG